MTLYDRIAQIGATRFTPIVVGKHLLSRQETSKPRHCANDPRCAGCNRSDGNCPDPVWSGAVPPSAASPAPPLPLLTSPIVTARWPK